MIEANLDNIRLQLEAQRDDLAGRLQNPGRKNGQAANGNDPQRSTALHARLAHILEQVEAALARLDEGDYGTCSQCGQPIRPERLEILPYTVLCVQCSTAQSQRA